MDYNFVGYGSLLDHESLNKTIKDKKLKPVIVKGYKRVFDLFDTKDKKDVLNIIKSKNSWFNGVSFKINEEELKKLSIREDEYNIEEINVYDYKTKKKIGKALISVDFFFDIDKKNRMPSKDYFTMCRKAAYSISKDFGKTWDETTFLADGTKVSRWLKKHGEYGNLN